MSDVRDLLDSFMDDYFAECEEHLTAARQNLLLLEPAVGHEPPADLIQELFRGFHSLKGISAMVELREAERLAHEMETCLSDVRDRRIGLTLPLFEALVSSTNALETVIAARRAGAAIPSIDQHLAALFGVAATGSGGRGVASPPRDPARPPRSVTKVTFSPSADLVARGIKVDTIRARLADMGRIEEVAPRVTSSGAIAFEFLVSGLAEDALRDWRQDGIAYEHVLSNSAPADVDDTQGGTAAAVASETTSSSASFVRVDLARLDHLMLLVGDLVVARARLEDTLTRIEPLIPAAEWRDLQEGNEAMERRLRDLRDGVMRVRLVSVSEIFRRMPFVVRDLARDSGKRVRIDLAGQSTEIDKFLIERMVDPILHLVRNAVSHGIETPEERIAAGKPPDGTIRLCAMTVGESVVLEVTDDGRGIDAVSVAQRARAAGLKVPDADFDARALLDVLCSPGFSTRDEADRASGRGVGMAVVRENIQELGGTLSLETALGRGTSFKAVLPLTLAIVDALIADVGDRTFAVPQSGVEEVAEVDPAALRLIENNELMVHRERVLPVVRLARLFALEAAPRRQLHALVVGVGSNAIAILVDRIACQREVVVKTLRDPLVKVAGVSGATELGDGRVVLILDVSALARTLRLRTTPVGVAV